MNRLVWMGRSHVNAFRNSAFKSSPVLLGPPKVSPYTCIFRGLHEQKKNAQSTLNYMIALGVMTVGLSYAAVPLYRIFCQAYSYGGTTGLAEPNDTVSTMSAVKNRPIKIRFNADVASSMQWNFRPQQLDITVVPGETALAFYTARNPTDKPVTGISTYNVIPFEAGQYFNKIQCFCFEEQQLNPHEQVDMPVFFYIDPEFTEDPKMEYVDEIVLSYTFFEAKEGMKLPVPSYVRN
ncbi:cytochrome c oxidase assembly protein COX11, mitochondrial isoform X1 [Pectinophora gossypiella]|uniref:cytochrome c oxidase assembly protein COX11, mitochondrial isoform X1 n=1 Tax=Pectinophora gossypiella TaxID=13191 RepID=UPI00214E1432|nr:cytochrome c oxidase assembly protein COX11, mitochondrial isoform X1 [Pectinophora gossypiella]